MKLLISPLLIAFSGAVFAGGGIAAHRSLFKYPCDVFMSTACFRLPNEMSVIYRVPADFGIYSIVENGKDLAIIYAGSAPNTSEFSDKLSFNIDSPSHFVKAFSTDEGDSTRIDIFLIPKVRNFISFHFQAYINTNNINRIADIVSGLRPCKKVSREAFLCPSESEIGKSLSEWIFSLRVVS